MYSPGLEIDAGEKPLLHTTLPNRNREFVAAYGSAFVMNV